MLDGALRAALDDMMWESDGLALAASYDDTTGRYQGLASYIGGSIGELTDSVLVVQPAAASTQLVADETAMEPPKAIPDLTYTGSGSKPEPTTVVTPERKDTRFFGVARVNPQRYARDLTRIAQEILQHLTAVEGTQLEVSVEITATNDAGFPDDRVRTVNENARTLKFDQFGFEPD